jgi:phage terminase large subunit-like protein
VQDFEMSQDDCKISKVTPEQIEIIRQRIIGYVQGVDAGTIVTNRWVYAAIKRFLNDLDRTDIYFDWEEAAVLNDFYSQLSLVGEWTGKPFELHDWQLFVVSNIICWKWSDTKKKRFKLSIVQIGRGNGKSTMMSGLLLYDLTTGMGKRGHIIANNLEQASIIFDTCKTMIIRLPKDKHDITIRHMSIDRDDADSLITPLPALERSLDGLNPSMWIADEASEFKGRFLTKLTTTGAKRTESTGVIISTPGSNPENIYMELIKTCEGILSGEIANDDTIFAMLYGLDNADQLDDERQWIKANPGMSRGQPDIASLRRAWKTMSQSPMGRAEFSRFHGSRFDENSGGWLDMSIWDEMKNEKFDMESLKGKPCWGGLDLSKSGDMTAFVLIFPLEGNKILVKGRYWFPREGLPQRELDYRIPVRTWEKQGKLETTPGREISYDAIKKAIQEACRDYDVRQIAFDSWGSQYLAEQLVGEGVPLVKYRMAISVFGPGCALFQNLWAGKQFMIPDDPILRRACAEAHAKVDINGNVRPIKSREYCIIDPLVATIMATHAWGGKTQSIYELEAEQILGNN